MLQFCFVGIQNLDIHHGLHLKQKFISSSFAGSRTTFFGTTAKGTFAV
jgi:hypothetical protein